MSKNILYDKSMKELFEIRNKDIKDIGVLFLLELIISSGISIQPLLVVPSYCMLYKIVQKCLKILKYFSNPENFMEESTEYQDAKKVYKILLQEILKLCKKLDVDNEIKIFSLYNYLYSNGFLSIDHTFYYKKTSLKNDFVSLLGLNVIVGRGDCKCVNSMFTDILKENGNEAYNLHMNLDKPIYQLGDIQLLCEEEENITLDQSIRKNESNVLKMQSRRIRLDHIVTLFANDQHSYIMDSINETIFSVYGGTAFQGDNFEIKYDDYFYHNKKKLSEILKDTNAEKLHSLLEDYESTLNMCKMCDEMFEKFYREHKELYEDIVDKKKILLEERSKFTKF